MKAQGGDGASLYIIIGLLAIFVLLCCLFYFTKWWREKHRQPHPETKPNEDIEEGKSLIEPSASTKTNSSGETTSTKTASATVENTKGNRHSVLAKMYS